MAFKERSTGAVALGAATDLDFGAPYVSPRRIRYVTSADTAASLSIVDADGYTVFADGSADYTTAVDKAVIYDGAEGSDGAAEGHGFKVFKNPFTATWTAVGSGTATVTIWGEV
jgi:hypothetical protein